MMSNRTKTILMYIVRGLDYLVWAGFFGLITYFYWFTSGGDMVVAYIANVTGISISLMADKIRIKRIYKKMEACTDDKLKSKLLKKQLSTLKTSLYLFYIFALIFSQLLAIGAPIEVSDNVRGYFQSVSYGVVLLFAIDNFFGYLIGDDERIRKFKDKYKDKPSDEA